MERTDFKIRVDDGEVQDYASAHSQYALAAMEAFGVLGLSFPCVVEIWSEALIPEYGPYLYAIDHFTDAQGREYTAPAIMSVRRG